MKTVLKALISVTILALCIQEVDGRHCKDKYRAIPGHTACIPRSPDHQSGTGLSDEDKRKVVELHNIYRSQENAKNMQKMVWDNEVAMIAQAWAENCDFRHDRERNIPGRFHVGQNLASGHLNWDTAIKAWYDERNKFSYNSDDMDLKDVGHFTQLAWAESAKLGCGFAQCRGVSKYYVCNYGPGGNIGSIKTPYQLGTQGQACPSKRDSNSLCDCHGKVCLNDGELDLETCSCTCNTKVDFYKPDTNCSLDCDEADDPDYCEDQYRYQACFDHAYVSAECPYKCRICPWAGIHYIEGSVDVPAKSSITTSSITMLFVSFVCALKDNL